MDTSEKYIKMCKEAKEIQKEWKSTSGDWLAHTHHGITKVGVHIYVGYRSSYNVFTGGGATEYYAPPKTKKNNIWLPRQDQLQEMVGIKDGYDFVHGFVDKVFTDETYMYYRSMTPNQIWLAFVMLEKYHKAWRDGTWKKAS